EERPPGRARDAMSYTITVENNGRLTVLTQSDTTMTPEFAALLGWLEKHFVQQ
ncbi:protealysin inhibitor emfourin, partial [Streptomyces sp. NPDC055186]